MRWVWSEKDTVTDMKKDFETILDFDKDVDDDTKSNVNDMNSDTRSDDGDSGFVSTSNTVGLLHTTHV